MLLSELFILLDYKRSFSVALPINAASRMLGDRGIFSGNLAKRINREPAVSTGSSLERLSNYHLPPSETSLRAGRDRYRMRSLIFHVSCLVLCTTGALSARLVAEPQEIRTKTPSIDQKGSACVRMAATLGSCLAAVSPMSSLTTMEESECCSRILLFQRAGCHW